MPVEVPTADRKQQEDVVIVQFGPRDITQVGLGPIAFTQTQVLEHKEITTPIRVRFVKTTHLDHQTLGLRIPDPQVRDLPDPSIVEVAVVVVGAVVAEAVEDKWFTSK